MSIYCTAEQYDALRIVIRISTDNEGEIANIANQIAAKAEIMFATKGSTVTFCNGRWDGAIEYGATIEVVKRINRAIASYGGVTNEALKELSYYINVGFNLTAFVTVDAVTAYELYELAE